MSGVPHFSRPLSARRQTLLDVVVAAGLLALFPAMTPAGVHHPTGLLLTALVIAMCLPLTVRRRWPVPVAVVVLTAAAVALVAGMVWQPFLAAGYALYPLAVSSRPRGFGGAITAGTLVALALALVGGAPEPWSAHFGQVLTGVVVLGGTWILGRAVRERRIYAARAAEQFAAAAVADERLRIARELHDVVTHSMGLIAVKAGVANHVLAVRPQEAHDALRIIERTSREALVEMRQMVGVLRAEPAGSLERLAGDARSAGVPVDLVVTGTMPEPLARAVHRIVQESLTNVVRHAGPASCRVRVEAGAQEVRVEVVDDGAGRVARGVEPPAGGHGLIGMRERATSHGGELAAGPVPGGGFRVAARLPVPARVPA